MFILQMGVDCTERLVFLTQFPVEEYPGLLAAHHYSTPTKHSYHSLQTQAWTPDHSDVICTSGSILAAITVLYIQVLKV